MSRATIHFKRYARLVAKDIYRDFLEEICRSLWNRWPKHLQLPIQQLLSLLVKTSLLTFYFTTRREKERDVERRGNGRGHGLLLVF